MFTYDISGSYIANPNLFDGLLENLPDKSVFPPHIEFVSEPPEIVHDIVIAEIMHTCMPFEIAYTDPEYLQWAITAWSKKESFIWQQLYETMCYKYVPYWNKDGKTSETETGSSTGKETAKRGTSETVTRQENISDKGSTTDNRQTDESIQHGGGTSEQHTGTDAHTTTGSETNAGTDTTTTSGATLTHTVDQPGQISTEKVAGFNSTDLVNNQQTTQSGSNVTDVTETDQGHTSALQHGHTISKTESDSLAHGEKIDLTDTRTEDREETEERRGSSTKTRDDKETIGKTGSDDSTTDTTGSTERTHEVYERGNIGVTTTQSMIEEQRKLVTFDLYKFIADRFKNEFCILIF